MKFLQLADLHGKPERADDFLKSLSVARDRATSDAVDLIILAGDIWNGVIRNTRGSRFPEMIEGVRSLADVAPVVMVYGTPTHDADGSLDIFPTLDSKFGITILQPGKAYLLTDSKGIILDADPSMVGVINGKAILFGVPEPSKKWLIEDAASGAEAEKSVRDRLRGLFAGLGAIRRLYASLPCVLVYHGQVGGAVLQNGELLDNGSGIRPSIDDLAMVDADYYALGDIHKPQQVGILPAYYPGSAYLKDFGETHEAGCNLVEIGWDEEDVVPLKDMLLTITRVPFGHPVNVTIKVKADLILGLTATPFLKSKITPGNRVKLEITCTKEEAPSIDEDAILEHLKVLGAVAGSVVEKKTIMTETVRAQEITELETLEAKALVWFAQSKKEAAPSVLAKIKAIEAETETPDDQQGPEKRFRNVSTLIRGSKGFWTRQRKDEVFIDWEALGPGVVAYVGPNGYGKTTSFDFSKPWPVPVSRPPKTLKNHFRLRDSLIENVYFDEVSGVRYKTKITIDAGIASGKTEYYLFRDIGQGYELVPGIEGRLDGYVDAVETIFGSLDIYMRTAYAAQKATSDRPDISEATKGEKKALIAELAGKDSFAIYQGAAKVRGDEIEAGLIPKQAEIDAKESGLPDEQGLKDQVGIHTEAQKSAHEELARLTVFGKQAQTKAEALGVLSAQNGQREQQATEAESLVKRANEDHAGTIANIAIYQGSVDAKSGAERTVQEFDALTIAVNREEKAYQQHLEAKQAEQRTVDEARKVYDEKVRVHREIQAGQRGAAASAREEWDNGQREARESWDRTKAAHDKTVNLKREALATTRRTADQYHLVVSGLVDEIARLRVKADQPLADHCSVCRQALAGEALAHAQAVKNEEQTTVTEAEKRLEKAQSDVVRGEENEKASADVLATLEANPPVAPDFPPYIETIEVSPDLPVFLPPPSTLPEWDDRNRSTLKMQLGFIAIEKARAIIAAAGQAQVRIEELTRQLDGFRTTAAREQARADELRAGLRPELETELAEAQAEHKRYQDLYRQTQGIEAQAAAALAQATQRLEDLSKDRQTIEAMKTALVSLKTEVAEWRLVEASIEGVRDLELDALAPRIAEIATRLLESSGRPGRIEIDTQRLSSGSGKRQRQIEDFIIFYVGQDGERQDIATCSGGEMVWQRKALYDAFSVIRARNARIRWTTALLDETDGALFPEDRVDYFRMLTAGHKESGRFQTILITQAAEIAEMAQTVIDVRELKGRV